MEPVWLSCFCGSVFGVVFVVVLVVCCCVVFVWGVGFFLGFCSFRFWFVFLFHRCMLARSSRGTLELEFVSDPESILKEARRRKRMENQALHVKWVLAFDLKERTSVFDGI